MANLHVGADITTWDTHTIIELDGEKCQTLRGFYETIADSMDFPDDFGFNLDSLDDMLSNLSWIAETQLAVYVRDSVNFLSKERNENKKLTLIDLLEAICEEWRWLEPDENEAENWESKQLVFLFDESENMRQLLKKANEWNALYIPNEL